MNAEPQKPARVLVADDQLDVREALGLLLKAERMESVIVSSPRAALDALYRSDAPEAEKRNRKAALFEALRAEHATLKRDRWGGFSGYDAWFARANNASLGVLAAYNDQVPDFLRLFERSGGDFKRFYAEVKRLTMLSPVERRGALAR